MSPKLQLNASLPAPRRAAMLAAITVTFAGVSGCGLLHHAASPASLAQGEKAPGTAPVPVDLTKVKPNEAGVVPILMYHNIKGDKINEAKLEYPVAMFRKDLDWLYTHNYRPVSLTQFVQGKVDCPAGTSPVIFTFDDGLRSQFSMTADGQI